MQPQEFSWKNPNGNKVYAVEWGVENARAVMGIIHGIGEHCRRYDEMAAWYNQHGIALIGYDRQGFGRSDGRKGYAEFYKEYVDEIATLLVTCEHRYPDLPVFLYGHSMGGHLLLRYLSRRNPNVSGAVVSAPHIRLEFKPNPFLVGLGKMLHNVYPTFTQENNLDTSLLSRNPAVRSAYENDPLVHAKITSRTGIDLLEAAKELDNYADGLQVDVLMMHGLGDKITSPRGTRDFAERNPDNLTLKLWPDLYHELHHEPERAEVYAFTLAWLEARMGAVHREPKSV